MATSLTLRNTKGSALTHSEMDANLTALRTTADNALAATDTLTANKAEATALGVANTDQNMGSFTGTTIADNVSAKVGMQSLETAVETKANASAVGVTSSAANMGTYTGTTIPDNETAKQNLQSLETAVEARVVSATLAASGGSDLVGFIQPSGTARTLQAKVREIEVNANDYSGATLGDKIDTAVAALGTTTPARLVLNAGTISAAKDWSAYRNITFVFRPGDYAQGTNTVVLPERVEMHIGAEFTGSGAVTVKNKDQLLLNTPPAQYVVASNEAMGVGALKSVTTGYNNFAWGYNSLNSLTAGRSNIAIGTDALKSVTGGTAVSAAGTYMSNGDGNIAIGDKTLAALTTGYENVGVGMYNMLSMTTGKWNTCVGAQNLELGTANEANVVVGCYNLVTYAGNHSVAIGFGVGENSTTGSNTAVGYAAMGSWTTANLNTAVGSEALTRITTGTHNVAVGHQAAQNVQTGVNNLAIGTNALNAAAGAATNNTAVGTNALLALASGDGNTALGSGAGNTIDGMTGTISIGLGVSAEKSNQAVIGNTSTVETKLFGVLRLATTYTVAGLPSAVTMGAGARSFVTDANATTFASVVAGGGANGVPVYSDGTNWRIG